MLFCSLAMRNGRRYNERTAGVTLLTLSDSNLMNPNTIAAKIGQKNAADMAIRFKALKMGASVEMINTMDVFALLDWISENV